MTTILSTITFTTYYFQFRIQFTPSMALTKQQYYWLLLSLLTIYSLRYNLPQKWTFNGNNTINYYFSYQLFTIFDTQITFLYIWETKWIMTNHHFNQNQSLHHRDHHYHHLASFVALWLFWKYFLFCVEFHSHFIGMRKDIIFWGLEVG